MLLLPKTFFFSLVLLTVCLCCKAQNQTIDSLRSVIASSGNEQNRLTAYIHLSGKLSLISFNETIKIAEKGIELAAKLKDSLAYAELGRNMGIAYYFKGDYEKAASLFFYSSTYL